MHTYLSLPLVVDGFGWTFLKHCSEYCGEVAMEGPHLGPVALRQTGAVLQEVFLEALLSSNEFRLVDHTAEVVEYV